MRTAGGAEKQAKKEEGGAIPWGDWFAAAVIQMKLAPDDFWRLTPREWRWLAAAFGPAGGAERLDVETLAALIAAYPDEKT